MQLAMSLLDYIGIGILVALWLAVMVTIIIAPLLSDDGHRHRRRSWWQ